MDTLKCSAEPTSTEEIQKGFFCLFLIFDDMFVTLYLRQPATPEQFNDCSLYIFSGDASNLQFPAGLVLF